MLKESADRSSIFCEQCRCQAGKHTCHKIFDCDIQKVECEKSVKLPGQCCPVCGEQFLYHSQRFCDPINPVELHLSFDFNVINSLRLAL